MISLCIDSAVITLIFIAELCFGIPMVDLAISTLTCEIGSASLTMELIS